jgi:hypothetical protein
MKFIARLVVVGLVANAGWHLMTAYVAHYRFKDAVEEFARYGDGLSKEQLNQRVMDLMGQFDIPASPDSFTVLREDNHAIIGGSYKRTVDLFPGYAYPWPFSWQVDTWSIRSQNPKDRSGAK